MTVFAFAQFGGGSGTESDPYRIYTLEHWNEFANEFNNDESAYGDFSGIHLRLMNDITDTIRTRMGGYEGNPNDSEKKFNGYIHGGGHSLIISMPVSPNGELGFFLSYIGLNGVIDSIYFQGNIQSMQAMMGLLQINYGLISNCSLNFDCSTFDTLDCYSGFAYYNYGTIQYCKNYTEIPQGAFCGICGENIQGRISHCTNYADMQCKSTSVLASGIVQVNFAGIVEYCLNIGNMVEIKSEVSGIVTDNEDYHSVYYDSVNMHWVHDTIKGIVRNCVNTGNLTMAENVYNSSAVGSLAGINSGTTINCLNTGNSTGVYPYEGQMFKPSLFGAVGGGIAGTCIIERNLNIGNTAGGFIADLCIEETDIIADNYNDKQMCRSLSIGGEYVESIAGGRLTSQLVGDTPELRAMLGDGWSYAEGRYPIPLGFENDSIVLRAATPIFLHAESDDDYEHIDSVASHFTVSTANGALWSTVSHNIEIFGEDATLRYVGEETLKTRYGNLYEKQIRLNIVNVPVVAETSEMQNISIFPNPTTNILNITSSETISEIEIVNVMGQVVRRIEVNSDNAVCDVEDLRSGVYVVRIRTLRYFGGAQQPQAQGAVISHRKFVKE